MDMNCFVYIYINRYVTIYFKEDFWHLVTFAVFSCQPYLNEQFLLKPFLIMFRRLMTCLYLPKLDDHVRLHNMKINPIFHPNPDAQHVHMSSNVTNITRRCLRFTCHKMAKKQRLNFKRPGEERRGENLEDSHHLQRSSSSSYGGTGDGLGGTKTEVFP